VNPALTRQLGRVWFFFLDGRVSVMISRTFQLSQFQEKLMKIQKSGKTVTIDRGDLEVLARHVGEFEKVVKTFERLEAAGKLAPDFQRQWNSTKKFLAAEESRIAGTQASAKGTTRERRKKRCCALILRDENVIVDCREITSGYVFAVSACVLLALAGDFNSQLSLGGCGGVGGCP
jgi:hypothetical protein